nr:AMP-binding protein [Shouchella clausii]
MAPFNGQRGGTYVHIADQILKNGGMLPHKTALVYKDRTRTYRDVETDLHSYRNALSAKAKECGFVRPLAFAIDIENQDELLLVFLAAASLGWTGIPLNRKWTNNERLQALARAEADVLFTDRPISEAECAVWDSRQVNETTEIEADRFAQGNDLFYLGFTSGSTGAPKAYVRTHHSWTTSFQPAAETFQLQSTNRVSVPGSLFHSLFLFAAVHTLHMGATLYLEPTFSPFDVLETIKGEQVDVIYGVPTMIEAFVKASSNETLEQVDTIIVSGAKWSKIQVGRAQTQFPNAKLYEFYGASELSFISSLHHRSQSTLPPTAVGRPFPGVTIQADDEGMLHIKSPYLFAGYKGGAPVKEWETVGDIGFIDKTGVVHVKGRKGNMLIIGGINVYPEEVEQLAKEIEGVEEAIAIGKAHPYWGSQMELYIKGRYLSQEDKKQIRTRLKEVLPPIKRPRRLHLVEAFPLLPSGKVDRQALRSGRYE